MNAITQCPPLLPSGPVALLLPAPSVIGKRYWLPNSSRQAVALRIDRTQSGADYAVFNISTTSISMVTRYPVAELRMVA